MHNKDNLERKVKDESRNPARLHQSHAYREVKKKLQPGQK